MTARPLLASVHSGGQTGVDVAALRAAKNLGLATAGTMPLGFRTHDGPRPDYAALYGCTEHASPEWAPRTRANVDASDATLRLAVDMDSPGERCTANACKAAGKLLVSVHMDLDWNGALVPVAAEVDEAIARLRLLAVKQGRPLVLNVAGNSERTAPGIEASAEKVLRAILPAIAAPLRVYTARVDYDGPDRLDVTAKSGGENGRPFAPSWDLLRHALDARKQATAARTAGRVDEARLIEAAAWEAYEPRYEQAMRVSYKANRGAWDAILARSVVTAVCYCAPAHGEPLRCHRRLLAGILVKLGAEDMGERPRSDRKRQGYG